MKERFLLGILCWLAYKNYPNLVFPIRFIGIRLITVISLDETNDFSFLIGFKGQFSLYLDDSPFEDLIVLWCIQQWYDIPKKCKS